MLATAAPLASVTTQGSSQVFSLDIQTLLLITLLAFLPAIVLMMTSFTRFIVVLAIFRQALGLTTTPPNILLIGLALILSAFVMRPTLETVNSTALQPYLAHTISFDEATKAALTPMRKFMIKQVRKRELHLFVNLSGHKGEYASLNDVPLLTLVPAFVTSELQSAFQIGFLIYIPFALIDLAVAAILMALGMIMVSPTLISLPIKLLLFISIGGWSLLLGSVARSVIH